MRRGVALSIAMSLANEAFARDVVASHHLAEQMAASCLGQSAGATNTNSRSESLAQQEIGRMNLSTFTRPAVVIVPAVCLFLLLGGSWYGYAQSNSDEGSTIQVDLEPAAGPSNDTDFAVQSILVTLV